MNYFQIRKMDISNGNEIGVSLFVSGCPIHCKNCFNKDAWGFESGKPFTEDTMRILQQLYMKPYIKRFSLLGGEPLAEQNIRTVNKIIRQVSSDFKDTDKKIWIYTGYTIKNLERINNSEYHQLCVDTIYMSDYLVDGQFVDAQKDLSLKFRGSTNQNIYHVDRTAAYSWLIDVTSEF